MLRPWSPTGVFLALAAAMALAEIAVVRSDAFGRAGGVLSGAVVVDLACVLPLLFWMLLVRRGLVRPAAMIGVAAGGLFAASVLIPHPPAYLAALRLLPALAELGLLVWGALVGRSFWAELRRLSLESDDALDNVHEALARTPGLPPLLRGAAAELVALWYGLLAFRRKAPIGPGVFAYYESLTPLVVLGFIATPAEGLVLHVMLRGWSPAAAWIATALHVYGLVWLVALQQAARLRPIVVTESALLVRWSLLWTARIPRSEIQSVQILKGRPEKKIAGEVDLARLADRPVCVALKRPALLHGPLGLRREASSLLLAADAPEKLALALSQGQNA